MCVLKISTDGSNGNDVKNKYKFKMVVERDEWEIKENYKF